jgi:hypothetical protein
MGCQIRLTTDQSVANTTLTVATLGGTDVDNTGQMANTASHEIVIRRAGAYQIVTCAVPDNSAAAIPRLFGSVLQNGTAAGIQAETAVYTSGSYATAFASGLLTCSVGDTLTLSLYQNSGGAQNFLGQTSGDATLLEALEILSW